MGSLRSAERTPRGADPDVHTKEAALQDPSSPLVLAFSEDLQDYVNELSPLDSETTGTEILSSDVRWANLKSRLQDLHASGRRLVLLFRPPPETFSRSRDRARRTRARSYNHPE